jgi:hypothetical protein
MSSTPIRSLDYAQPTQVLRPVNLVVARAWFGLSILSVSIGVLILLAYRLTAHNDLVGAGLLWLTAGGLLTTTCLITSMVMLAMIKPAALNAMPGRSLYLRTLAIALCSYGVAFLCVVLGANWAEGPHFRVRVYNDTDVLLDQVRVDLPGRQIALGPVPARGAVASGLNWSGSPGDVHVTLEARGEQRRFLDRRFDSKYHLQQPYFDVRIEPRELPRSLRPVAP